MRKITSWFIPFVAVTLLTGTCAAQNPEPKKFYKLEFAVKEVEAGKVLNARVYSVTASNADSLNSACSIRTGSKVPTPTNPSGAGGMNFTFIDVGVNIDCFSITETQNGLSLRVSADISSILQEGTPPAYPVIRQNKWHSNVMVPFKKPTTICSSDDATTKRQMQLELTATPIQ